MIMFIEKIVVTFYVLVTMFGAVFISWITLDFMKEENNKWMRFALILMIIILMTGFILLIPITYCVWINY